MVTKEDISRDLKDILDYLYCCMDDAWGIDRERYDELFVRKEKMVRAIMWVEEQVKDGNT